MVSQLTTQGSCVLLPPVALRARTRTRYAFETLGLRMPLSEALDGNEASIRMLRRCGYVGVGRIPRCCFKRVAYRDALLFALERS